MILSDTSSSMMKTLVAGKTVGWEVVVELYQPLVINWCRQVGLKQKDSVDISQKVFRKVIQNIKDCRFDVYGFRKWLKGITIEKIEDHYRKVVETIVARGGMDALGNFTDIPEKYLDEKEFNDEQDSSILLIQALELIKDLSDLNEWNMTWDVVIQGEKVQEVALKYHVSVCAVFKAKSRILTRVHHKLYDLIE